MNNTKEMQKFAVILSACFAAALVAAALLFSMFFDLGGQRLQTSEYSQRAGDPCREEKQTRVSPHSSTTTASTGDELAPLEPEQEELLAADGALAPAEILGLNEVLEQVTGEAKPVVTPEAVAPKTEPVAAGVAATTATPLQAPEKLSPQRKADLRRRPFVRFHWDAVTGAAAYRLQAWQLDGSKKVMLIDQEIKETEYRAEPKLEGNVYWTVAAVDSEGNLGEVAGPITIDLLKNETRTPASRK